MRHYDATVRRGVGVSQRAVCRPAHKLDAISPPHYGPGRGLQRAAARHSQVDRERRGGHHCATFSSFLALLMLVPIQYPPTIPITIKTPVTIWVRSSPM